MKRSLVIVLWLATLLLCAAPGGLLILTGLLGLPTSVVSAIAGYQLLGSDPQAEAGLYTGLIMSALSLSLICFGGLLTLMPLMVTTFNKRSRGENVAHRSGCTIGALLAAIILCVLPGLVLLGFGAISMLQNK